MPTKSLSDIVFSILGSISILSVFVVVPYMIGYFTYFDRSLLNVFSLAEYYYFSAVPILAVSAFFILYAAYPLLMEQFNALPLWALNFIKPLIRSAIWRERLMPSRLTIPFVHKISNITVLVSTPILIAAVLVSFPLHTAIAFMPIAFGAIVISVSRIIQLPSYLVYFLMFLCFESMLVAWGYLQADLQFHRKKEIDVTSEKLAVKGALIFLGSGHVAIFDSDNNVMDVNVDKAAIVNLGKFAPASTDCMQHPILDVIRNTLKLPCTAKK